MTFMAFHFWEVRIAITMALTIAVAPNFTQLRALRWFLSNFDAVLSLAHGICTENEFFFDLSKVRTLSFTFHFTGVLETLQDTSCSPKHVSGLFDDWEVSCQRSSQNSPSYIFFLKTFLLMLSTEFVCLTEQGHSSKFWTPMYYTLLAYTPTFCSGELPFFSLIAVAEYS